MPSVSPENLENLDRQPNPHEEMNSLMADLIRIQGEIIKETGKDPEEWIEENSAKFRKIAPRILAKYGNDKETAKKEIKERLKTIH